MDKWENQSLAADSVAVWYFEDQGEDLLPQGLDMLNPVEQHRYHDFSAPGKQREYLIGRLFCRRVLQQYLGDAALQAEWGFSENRKPLLRDSDWHFNLSHSFGRYACMVSPRFSVGVDLEFEGRRVRPQYVKRVFTDYERAGLAPLSGNDYTDRFFQIWTLKEAYWKALDPGPELEFRDFGFHFHPLKVESPRSEQIQTEVSRPADDCRMAIAVWGEAQIQYYHQKASLLAAML